jgi:hypothetical protein
MEYVYARRGEMDLISVSDRVILHNKYNIQAITPQYSKKKPKETKGYVSRNEVYEEYFVSKFVRYNICGPYQSTAKYKIGNFQREMVDKGMFFRDGYAYNLNMYKTNRVNVFGKVMMHITKKDV